LTASDRSIAVHFTASLFRYAENSSGVEVKTSTPRPPRNCRTSPSFIAVTISAFNLPGGPGVRVDTFVYSGYQVTPFYDSLIAKVIVHARTRELAIARMKRALEAMVIEGIKTTVPLHLKIMDDPRFRAGDIGTDFMEYFLARNGKKAAAP